MVTNDEHGSLQMECFPRQGGRDRDGGREALYEQRADREADTEGETLHLGHGEPAQ